MTTLPPDSLEICPHCGCRDFFVRKDFPQKLGVSIVIAAGIAFLFFAAWPNRFWIGALILLGATLIDAIIYFFVGQVTVCYRCRGEFRDGRVHPDRGGFDLATAEKYRGAEPPNLHG